LKRPKGCFFILKPIEQLPGHPVIVFDGICNFCNAGINFIIIQDKKKVFRFAALQSEAGQRLLEEYGLAKEGFASFLLIENGRIYQKSTAGLKVCNKLPWYWKWTQLGWLAPKFIRDAIYDLIARNRYKWFGRKDQCMIPSPGIKNRFLSEP
jgi:predicted DCC family thiol-disulfide oxidoreductase YuxK